MPSPLLYYVRHGETDWNVESRLQGSHDVALNAAGRRQAAVCGDILRDLMTRDARAPVDFTYISSPLVRARETMQIVRTALDLDRDGYRVDPRLREISFGRWEGLTLQDIRAREPQALAARERDKWRFVPPDGESYEEVCTRMRAWHATLDDDAVVVAHGGTARALIAVLGIAPPEAAPLMTIEQGVVYRLVDNGITRYQ